jgi:hypothetical protein
MKDCDIRSAFLSVLTCQHKDDPDTLVVEELGLCEGEARVDIAVVNGCIHGFEIKSEQDTLKRLSGQVFIYSRVLDRITLVVSEIHLREALTVIPSWWGVLLVRENKGQITFAQKRKGRQNPNLDPFAIAQLLWRREAYEALRQRNLHTGLAGKPRASLWERLSGQLPLSELGGLVRSTLKLRQNWRSG